MTRLQTLIKEVLSQPKKKDCGCGCNDCGGKAPILTEGKVKHLISEGLQYHMDKKIQLHESVYRIGSEKHFELIREARALWVRGIIDVSEDDQAILETNLGHFGMYEGEAVPLDMPMVNEEVDEDGFSDKIIKSVIKPEEVSRLSKVLNSANIPFKTEKLGKVTMFKFKSYDDVDKVEALISRNRIDIDEVDRYSGFNRNPEDPDSVPFKPTGSVSEFREELRALFGKFKGDLKNPDFIKGVAQIMVNWKPLLRSQLDEAIVDYDFSKEELIRVIKQLKRGASTEIGMIKAFEKALGRELTDDEIRGFKLDEAKKKKKKDPPIGKPKRGGSKAYYVYVRDPKTKRIKKVSFGSGGLRAKIRNPKARKAFAARHKCSQKTDRTKPSYWSCRLPRYAKQLGLGSNMNTFW